MSNIKDTIDQAANAEPPPLGLLLNLIRADGVEITPIKWLWPGYLAVGKLHIMGGAPGVGKSTVALRLGASVTTGLGWPDGHISEPGNVLIWSGEDDISDTLAPRLLAAGAKMDKVFFIGDVCGEAGGSRPFNPALDMLLLQKHIRKTGDIKLLIVDPVVSAINGDSHKNAEVRQSLQPLADLAAAEGVAILGITHFAKNSNGREPFERIVGSIAFTAFARIVLICAKQKNSDVRVFCRAKSNIGLDTGGFEYSLVQTTLPDNSDVTGSFMRWGAVIEGEARDILASAESLEDGVCGALDEAKDFLREILKDAPKESKLVQSEGKAAGISEITLRRARLALDVKIFREGFGRGSKVLWGMPPLDAHTCSSNSIDVHQNLCTSKGNREQVCADSQDESEIVTGEI